MKVIKLPKYELAVYVTFDPQYGYVAIKNETTGESLVVTSDILVEIGQWVREQENRIAREEEANDDFRSRGE